MKPPRVRNLVDEKQLSSHIAGFVLLCIVAYVW